MSLEVTNVVITMANNATGKIKAYARITFNDLVEVDGFKVINGSKGLFVGAPSRQDKKSGKWFDTIRFVDAFEDGDTPGKQFKNKLSKTVIGAYQNESGATGEDNFDQTTNEDDEDVPF